MLIIIFFSGGDNHNVEEFDCEKQEWKNIGSLKSNSISLGVLEDVPYIVMFNSGSGIRDVQQYDERTKQWISRKKLFGSDFLGDCLATGFFVG